MKFYTTAEYAEKIGVDEAVVKKQAIAGKVKSINVTKSQPNLIMDQENTETSIIGLMNLKGGAGKTTLASHLAVMLSKIGLKVLLIDTDHQAQCKLFFPQQDYEFALDDILSQNANVKDAIYSVNTENSKLDIIYSSYSLALFAHNYKNLDGFLEMVNKVKDDYDFIVVDTSPNFDIINRNVATTVTHIIIPVIPTNMHVEGIEHQRDALQKIAHVPLERIIGIIPNNVNEKKVEHPSYIEYLKEVYTDVVFDTYIPGDPWLEKVSTYGTNLFDYREKSRASQALKKFTWETLRRL